MVPLVGESAGCTVVSVGPPSLPGMGREQSFEDEALARLDALEVESRVRRDELRALVADLPAATSRRAYLVQMVTGFLQAPGKPEIVRRVAMKIVRTPADLVRRSR